MFGLLNVDKPGGWTSRDAVNHVQRLVRPHKVGHAGTLDPLATGVLVIAIGPATRLVEYVQRMAKTYQATFLLGRTSDTEDVQGRVVELANPPRPTCDEILTAVQQFLGVIEQQPPSYSAIKVTGLPAYKLARRGQAVELAPRKIEIHSIELLRYEYPEMELLVTCGGGTYIRSLGRDLAESLGTGAVMCALRRQAIGPFRIDAAINCQEITAAELSAKLLPPVIAMADLPRLELTDDQIARVSFGQTIENAHEISAAEIVAIDSRGQLIAVLRPTDGRLGPSKCFVQS